MISEHRLARSPAFWSQLTPLMDSFVRVLNAEANQIPVLIPSEVDPGRRAFVNECAYELVVRNVEIQDLWETEQGPLAEIAVAVWRRLYGDPFSIPAEIRQLSLAEATEANKIASRLQLYLLAIKGTINPAPRFQGCGFVSGCTGDFLVDDCLVEVKSGRRAYRSEDVRQLVVYLSLNYAAQTHDIGHIALVNPRELTFARMPVATLAYRIAAIAPDELFERFVYQVSSGAPSR